METLSDYIDALELERLSLYAGINANSGTIDEIDSVLTRIIEIETLLHPDLLTEWEIARRKWVIDDILEDLENGGS